MMCEWFYKFQLEKWIKKSEHYRKGELEQLIWP